MVLKSHLEPQWDAEKKTRPDSHHKSGLHTSEAFGSIPPIMDAKEQNTEQLNQYLDAEII